MAAHLLILYPQPTDAADFAKAYRDEHLPFAGPRLTGATAVASRKIIGPGETPPFHFLSDVTFPDIDTLQRCAQSAGGQEALAHAASISSGGAPTVLGTVDAD
ncbi:EthD family reductase [Sphingomonas sp. URHD0057]|uniref:EthD family reductase n=1 Tax=Sphingomonas sp. URHD0057 TaxID=1380389 RepID=UPI000686086A|nr:EthD family reductase [Sphingomonas sp. URHD0057]